MLVCAASSGVTHTPPHSSLSFCSSNAKSHRIFSNSVSLPITHNDNPTSDSDDALRLTVPSAAAVASAIRKASTSPVQFTQTLQTDRQTGLVLPSTDFHRLCLHQLHLFRRIVPEALLSVYVRPAGSYVMDRLELRRVALYPGDAESEGIVILVGHFSIPAGLRTAEATLSNLQVNVVPECKAVVLPMVKHPFVVGFLVAELPLVEEEQCQKAQSEGPDIHTSVEEAYSLPPFLDLDKKSREIQTLRVKDEKVGMRNFTSEQRSNAVNISQSLAMAYVMDQVYKLPPLFSFEQKKKIHSLTHYSSNMKWLKVLQSPNSVGFPGNLHFITVATCMCALIVVALKFTIILSISRLSYCYVVACNACLLSLFLYDIVVWVHDFYNNSFNFLSGPKFLMVMLLLQKAMLLQQSTWQNNVRMGNLVEQIRGPLSSIQTLSKILSAQTKRTQISYDIVEDLLVQGNRLRDVLQQLQDAVYLTKNNIVRYNEEAIKKMNGSTHILAESARSQLLDNSPGDDVSSNKMKNSRRSCNVSEVLTELVDSVRPLAQGQKRLVELSELSSPLLAAVEEPALRQAFSNLIEGALLRTHVGGKVEIVSTAAPAGGTLVLIDDDGPDMHYMTQMHSLTPYGQELLSDGMIEDNMTWNFVAGMTVAREILESYGCVVRIVSPRIKDAPLGAGGTRLELWLPSTAKSDLSSHTQEGIA
ncbi:Chloroplast sensor kinase [Vigna angularis]|uniref:Chloroplast sensor kinase n=1 Tax=Phaseolus angularis TaxID=3914 RepID=A0A8T0LEQ0_PHAAN|nr:Chloroplast sensor kinase [Vigna angularis]